MGARRINLLRTRGRHRSTALTQEPKREQIALADSGKFVRPFASCMPDRLSALTVAVAINTLFAGHLVTAQHGCVDGCAATPEPVEQADPRTTTKAGTLAQPSTRGRRGL